MESLPKLVLECIFMFLSQKDLYNCCLVAKKWNMVIQESSKMWKRLFFDLIESENLSSEIPALQDFPKEMRMANGEVKFKNLLYLFGCKPPLAVEGGNLFSEIYDKGGATIVNFFEAFPSNKKKRSKQEIMERMEECFVHHCIKLKDFDPNKTLESKLQFKIFQKTKLNPKGWDEESHFSWEAIKCKEINFNQFAVGKKSILWYTCFEAPYGFSRQAKKDPIFDRIHKLLFPVECIPSLSLYQFNGEEFVKNLFDLGKEWWGVFNHVVYCPIRNLVMVFTASTTD